MVEKSLTWSVSRSSPGPCHPEIRAFMPRDSRGSSGDRGFSPWYISLEGEVIRGAVEARSRRFCRRHFTMFNAFRIKLWRRRGRHTAAPSLTCSLAAAACHSACFVLGGKVYLP